MNIESETRLMTGDKVVIGVLVHSVFYYSDLEKTGCPKPPDNHVFFSEDQERRAFFLLLRYVRSRIVPKFSDLLQDVKEIGHNQFETMFINDISELLNEKKSVDKLHQLFTDLDNQKSEAESNTVIGFFLRRYLMAFEYLQFEETTSLLKSIRILVEGKSRNEAADPKDMFLEEQGRLLEIDERQVVSPTKLQTMIESSQKRIAPFVAYMNSMRVKDFPQALFNLHSYFDREYTKKSDICGAILAHAAAHSYLGMQKSVEECMNEAVEVAPSQSPFLSVLTWLPGIPNLTNIFWQQLNKAVELAKPQVIIETTIAMCRMAEVNKTIPLPIFIQLLTYCANYAHLVADNRVCSNQVAATKAALFYKSSLSSLACLQAANILSDAVCNSELQAKSLVILGKLHSDKSEFLKRLFTEGRKRFPQFSKFSEVIEEENIKLCEIPKTINNSNWAIALNLANNIELIDEDKSVLKILIKMERYDDTGKLLSFYFQNQLNNLPSLKVKLLLYEAYLLQSTSQFALRPLTEALCVCNDYFICSNEKMDILIHICYQLLAMRLPGKTLSLMKEIPKLKCTNSNFIQNELKLIKAKAYVILGSLNKALNILEKFDINSLPLNKIISISYLKARLYHVIGDVRKRNECSQYLSKQIIGQQFQNTHMSLLVF